MTFQELHSLCCPVQRRLGSNPGDMHHVELFVAPQTELKISGNVTTVMETRPDVQKGKLALKMKPRSVFFKKLCVAAQKANEILQQSSDFRAQLALRIW